MKSSQFNISFEFYPPKTADGMKNLHNTAMNLENFTPQFFSVTFGAGASTRQGTLQTVTMLQEKTAIPIAPHLSCMGCSRLDLIEIINKYKSQGIKRIVALRGDLPSGMGKGGELLYANELVSLIREISGDYFHIEVAAYPEVHPQAKSSHDDILRLKNKIDAGANSIITQYFYNPDSYFYFRDECIKHGIFAPIVPGIMPITQFAKLIRFSDTCGAEIPRWLRKRLESYGDDHDSIQKFGFEFVYHFCERLMNENAPGLHFYTLNHYEASAALVELLKKHREKSLLNRPYIPDKHPNHSQ